MAWPNAMSIVEEEWLDSSRAINWVEVDEMLEEDIALCRTVGYLLVETDDKITVLLSQSKHGHVCQAMIIPRCAIQSMRVIEAGKSPS